MRIADRAPEEFPSYDGIGLAAINALTAAEATRVLLACCPSREWVERVLAGRPYGAPDALYAASDAAVDALSEAGLAEALEGHPRIGQRSGPVSRESRREQAGVTGSDAATLAALAEGNADYERRFGHVYLVRASGRTAPEMLSLLKERLGNDPAAERRVVRGQLAEITRLRLERVVGEGVS